MESVRIHRTSGKDRFESWAFDGCFWSRVLDVGDPSLSSTLYIHKWGFQTLEPELLGGQRLFASDGPRLAWERSLGVCGRARPLQVTPQGSFPWWFSSENAKGDGAAGSSGPLVPAEESRVDALPLHEEVTRTCFLFTAFFCFLFIWGLSLLGAH